MILSLFLSSVPIDTEPLTISHAIESEYVTGDGTILSTHANMTEMWSEVEERT